MSMLPVRGMRHSSFYHPQRQGVQSKISGADGNTHTHTERPVAGFGVVVLALLQTHHPSSRGKDGKNDRHDQASNPLHIHCRPVSFSRDIDDQFCWIMMEERRKLVRWGNGSSQPWRRSFFLATINRSYKNRHQKHAAQQTIIGTHFLPSWWRATHQLLHFTSRFWHHFHRFAQTKSDPTRCGWLKYMIRGKDLPKTLCCPLCDLNWSENHAQNIGFFASK